MRIVIATAIVLLAIAATIFFDDVVIFLLSGFIPALDVTLEPSTMLAVLTASTIMMVALAQRRLVYQYSLRLYDALFGFGKKDAPSPTTQKSKLPRRRYQQL